MNLRTQSPGVSDRDGSRGQALPEFALVLPLFAILLFGIIQLGFLFAGQNGLTQATREAARYASTLPTPTTRIAGSCTTAGTNAKAVYDRLTDPTSGNLRQYIPGYLPPNLVTGSGCATAAFDGTGTGVGYCAYRNPDGTYSIRVRVRAMYRHPLFIPLVGRLVSSTDTWQLGATEEMRIEGPDRPTAGGFAPCL